MVADRQRLLSRGLQHVGKALREPFERVSRGREIGEGAGGQLDLRRGLDGDRLARAGDSQKVAVLVGGGARIVRLQLAQHPRHAVFAAVRDGAHIVVHDDLLQLDAQLTRAAEGFDAAFEVADDGVDVAFACRLPLPGCGCFIHVASS